MQNSLIKVQENEAGDIVLMYINSENVEAFSLTEPQVMIISKDDAEHVASMLSQYAEGN